MNDELRPAPWLSIHEELGVGIPEVDHTPLGTYIERYTESIPDNPALQYFEREICYRELNELTNRLANALAAVGVGSNDVVGLYMPNVPQYVIGALAVLKLGATATGVSPLLAPAEVASQLEDAGVKVLIALDSLAKPTLEALDGQGKLPVCVRAVIVVARQNLDTYRRYRRHG